MDDKRLISFHGTLVLMQVQTLDPSNVEALTSRLANFIQILLEHPFIDSLLVLLENF